MPLSVSPVSGAHDRWSALASDLASTTQLAKQGRGGRCYPESPEGSEVRDIVRACRRPSRRPTIGNKSKPARPPTPHQASPQDKMATTHCAQTQNFSIADFLERIKGSTGKPNCEHNPPSRPSARECKRRLEGSHLHGTGGTELRHHRPHHDPPTAPHHLNTGSDQGRLLHRWQSFVLPTEKLGGFTADRRHRQNSPRILGVHTGECRRNFSGRRRRGFLNTFVPLRF